MPHIFLYAHGGSANHGCEAIVRSTLRLLGCTPQDATLISAQPEEDARYGVDKHCSVRKEQSSFSHRSPDFFAAYLRLKLRHNALPMDKLLYKKAFSAVRRGDLALSIGGDNYCYADAQRYIMMHDLLLRRGAKTVLWGCSVEPELLKNDAIARDLARYRLIVAREAISFSALRRVNPNTILLPDPAFALERRPCALPVGFQEGNTVGINLSPMVIENETVPGTAMANYRCLIERILAQTDMTLALIPHVVTENGDDRVPLRALFDSFSHTGRVLMVEDRSCTELKYLISRCRFFVGARTHATIAAYSTGVPTLAIGYSVKARGIARDLFGTEEGYVLPVQSLREAGELAASFARLMQREDEVRAALALYMQSHRPDTTVRKIIEQELAG